jgi:hypothetical protein
MEALDPSTPSSNAKLLKYCKKTKFHPLQNCLGNYTKDEIATKFRTFALFIVDIPPQLRKLARDFVLAYLSDIFPDVVAFNVWETVACIGPDCVELVSPYLDILEDTYNVLIADIEIESQRPSGSGVIRIPFPDLPENQKTIIFSTYNKLNVDKTKLLLCPKTAQKKEPGYLSFLHVLFEQIRQNPLALSVNLLTEEVNDLKRWTSTLYFPSPKIHDDWWAWGDTELFALFIIYSARQSLVASITNIGFDPTVDTLTIRFFSRLTSCTSCSISLLQLMVFDIFKCPDFKLKPRIVATCHRNCFNNLAWGENGQGWHSKKLNTSYLYFFL